MSGRVALTQAGKSFDSAKNPRLKVLDFGTGMASAIVTRCFVDLGSQVIRIEPPSGDPFYGKYPAYGTWHRGKVKKNIRDTSEAQLADWIANADVCVTGGEDFPGLDGSSDPQKLAQRNAGLVILSITAYPEAMPQSKGAAAKILVQARSGLCFEHYTGRPLRMSFEPCNYGAALQGLA